MNMLLLVKKKKTFWLESRLCVQEYFSIFRDFNNTSKILCNLITYTNRSVNILNYNHFIYIHPSKCHTCSKSL